MKNVVFTILFMFSFNLTGQIHYLGLTGGISNTKATTVGIGPNSDDARRGLITGLSYSHRFENNFYLGSDLLYSQKGFTYDFIITDDNGNATEEKYIISSDYDYLSLPLKGGYVMGNKISGFFNVGVVPSVLINAIVTIPPIRNLDGEKLNTIDELNKLDLGGLIEVGANCEIKERYFLSLFAAYQQSFISVIDNDINSTLEITHYGVNLSLRFSYILKNN